MESDFKVTLCRSTSSGTLLRAGYGRKQLEITGPNLRPGNRIGNKEQPLTIAGRSAQKTSGDNESAAPKAAHFVSKNADIPPAELKSLANELAALGLDISELDGDSILRAYLLKRHNIPLDPLVVNAVSYTHLRAHET